MGAMLKIYDCSISKSFWTAFGNKCTKFHACTVYWSEFGHILPFFLLSVLVFKIFSDDNSLIFINLWSADLIFLMSYLVVQAILPSIPV